MRTARGHRAARWMCSVAITLAMSRLATAQTAPPTSPPTEPQPTMISHAEDQRWWLSGQINLIGQGHGAFRSAYNGPNSLRAKGERALSSVWTVDMGVRVSRRVEVLFDVESAGGRGISDAFGLAGFSDLDVVRNPNLGAGPYIARAMAHVTIPLGAATARAAPGPLSLTSDQPARRIEMRVGKMGLVDFFDINAVGSDSHLQFMNWTIDNTGAYDYAADTRGYTYAALIEYDTPQWSVRAAEALMPTVANGIVLDWHLARARAENVELEMHPRSNLTIRLLGYANHANMGSYANAISAFRQGIGARPDIEAHREQGRVKEGVAANVDYTATHGMRFFARMGWNEGASESFAYTEVNDTLAGGGDISGDTWRRANDRVGVAVASNGLSSLHQTYLRLGGLGFLLGDGNLRYGRETIVETYYTAHLWRGIFASVDGQYVTRPGYNRDRGPVVIGGLRMHVDF